MKGEFMKTPPITTLVRSTLFCLSVWAVQAQAHFLWIEAVRSSDGIVLKAGFGEKGEWDPQYGPTMEKTHYWLEMADGKTKDITFQWDEKKECFTATLSKESGSVVYGKLKWGIFSREGVPASLLYYYPKVLLVDPARWTDLKPSTNTDVEIVLTAEGSVAKFQALSGGKPLPEAKVKFYAPTPPIRTSSRQTKRGKESGRSGAPACILLPSWTDAKSVGSTKVRNTWAKCTAPHSCFKSPTCRPMQRRKNESGRPPCHLPRSRIFTDARNRSWKCKAISKCL